MNLLTLVISSYAFLLTAELVLYVWYSDTPAISGEYRARILYSRANDLSFDARTPSQVVEDYRRKGIEAYPPLRPEVFMLASLSIRVAGRDIVPVSGIPDAHTVVCNEGGGYFEYKSDRLGFHNPPAIYENERLSIAVIGDSYAEGDCVKSGEDFPSLIRMSYPATGNYGLASTGPLAQLAVLKEYVAPFRPRVVLWAYYDNDLLNLDVEKKTFFMNYLEPNFSLGLIDRTEEVRAALVEVADRKLQQARAARNTFRRTVMLWRLREYLKLNQIRRRLTGAVGRDAATDAENRKGPLELFGRIAKAMKADVESWDGRLIFVYIPSFASLLYPDEEGGHRYRESVLNIVRDTGLDIVDIYQAMIGHDDIRSLYPLRGGDPDNPIGGHFDADGYKIVAEEILDKIAGLQLSIRR